MPNMTSDQEIRTRILEICEGRVSEAKMAYYWVMGEQNLAKAAPKQESQQARQQREMQEHVAMEAAHAKGRLGQQEQDRFPLVGCKSLAGFNGSSD